MAVVVVGKVDTLFRQFNSGLFHDFGEREITGLGVAVVFPRNARHAAFSRAKHFQLFAERRQNVFVVHAFQTDVHRNRFQIGFFEEVIEGHNIQTGITGGFHAGVAAFTDLRERRFDLVDVVHIVADRIKLNANFHNNIHLFFRHNEGCGRQNTAHFRRGMR